ncbi:MAG: radical SAM protein, partial [Spirochaetes bacterium]|nr:radical SAM protein [Spirochaetota bacterium]
TYTNMTKKNYFKIVKCIKNNKIKEIRLIGGEPLLHPGIHWLIKQIKKDFPKIALVLITNGFLLHILSEQELYSFVYIGISLYPDNKKIIDKYKNMPNVYIRKSTEMWSPNRDPNFDIKTAIKYHKICLFKQPRFIGSKMYGCCIAEGIERTYKTEKVHKEVSKNWLEDYKTLPTYKACQHCFRALDMHNNWKFKMRNRIGTFILKIDWLYNIYIKFRLWLLKQKQ